MCIRICLRDAPSRFYSNSFRASARFFGGPDGNKGPCFLADKNRPTPGQGLPLGNRWFMRYYQKAPQRNTRKKNAIPRVFRVSFNTVPLTFFAQRGKLSSQYIASK
jgi:hypothetical protein